MAGNNRIVLTKINPLLSITGVSRVLVPEYDSKEAGLQEDKGGTGSCICARPRKTLLGFTQV